MIRLSGESWDRRVRSLKMWGDDGGGVCDGLLEDGGLAFAVLAKDLPKIMEIVRRLPVHRAPRDPEMSWIGDIIVKNSQNNTRS